MANELNRITYVEDEPDIRTVVQIALETVGGFTLDVCASGREALEKAPNFEPDLVLLDVMMPEMDGTETLKRLRAMPGFADTPIVFMTAKAQSHEIDAYKALGAA
ncbi:MAG: response regulator, partial [Methyloligellaceae bacterium]